MRIHRHSLTLIVLLLAPLARGQAQSTPDIQQILQRLDRLESENRELREQVHQLQQQMQPAAPPAPAQNVEERLDIEERRTAELAQAKVEASQRFPLRLTGMALVNSFYNSQSNGGADNSTTASTVRGAAAGGATWRQTILGLDYRGPQTFWGGKIHGSVFMDFFGGTNAPLGSLLRIRTAELGIDWASRSFTVSQDKPIISPREPDSLSQVGIAPLTAAGNLWLWLPQVRFEQRLRFGEQTGLNARVGVVQTSENSAAVPAAFTQTLERYRPGYEGRFEFFRKFGDTRRIEIAPGFHASATHVAGGSTPSRAFAIDWLIRPAQAVELTGFFFSGENVANLGSGLRQGFSILGPRNILSVNSQGGWAQLKLIATDRLSFHLLAGQHDDRDADLRSGLGAGGAAGGVGKNQAYGANFFFKLAPNVIMSFETLQTRTTYLLFGNRLLNHYDLAFAYLF